MNPVSPFGPVACAREELLETAAPLARALSARLCTSKLGSDSCAALHGVWPDLRRLGLAATPWRHGAFYARELVREAPPTRLTRVLISGSADAGMLEVVADAFGRRGAAVAPTVLDLCPTPLLLCAWTGARLGVPVRTIAGDLLGHHEPGAYDVVCTHSLLRSFPRARQPEAVACWRALLRPGGALVTVVRLDPEGDDRPHATPDAVAAFGARAEAEARRRGDASELAPAEIAARARRFAAAALSHPVGSEATLVALFEGAGLAVEKLAVRRLAGAVGGGERAPGAAQAAAYAELVAVRR